MRGVFREDGPPVGRHVEHTVAALDELGVDTEPAGERSGQTGRLGTVVSANAVGDPDVHATIIARRCAAHADRQLSHDQNRTPIPIRAWFTSMPFPPCSAACQESDTIRLYL